MTTPVRASRVRKGTFTLKTAADTAPVVFSCSPTSITLTPEAGDTGDDLEVLCGTSITGEPGPTKWTLNLVSIQQIEATDESGTSLALYALAHDGQSAEFVFRPGPTTKEFTGTVTVIALGIGGEVGPTAPTSEAEWPMAGPPTVVTPEPPEGDAQAAAKTPAGKGS
ncbi:hypothetical protein ABZV92_06005 [Streptomyces rubiginosohelvolus]|uniref:hypothetical protein n=1 Tax=Streptomyces rubiginosohelvolus TaxID=67362 RepID=UPI0033A7A394